MRVLAWQLGRLKSRRRQLQDLKRLVKWFMEEERTYLAHDDLQVLDGLLTQEHLPKPAQDRAIAGIILAVESRKGYLPQT